MFGTKHSLVFFGLLLCCVANATQGDAEPAAHCAFLIAKLKEVTSLHISIHKADQELITDSLKRLNLVGVDDGYIDNIYDLRNNIPGHERPHVPHPLEDLAYNHVNYANSKRSDVKAAAQIGALKFIESISRQRHRAIDLFDNQGVALPSRVPLHGYFDVLSPDALKIIRDLFPELEPRLPKPFLETQFPNPEYAAALAPAYTNILDNLNSAFENEWKNLAEDDIEKGQATLIWSFIQQLKKSPALFNLPQDRAGHHERFYSSLDTFLRHLDVLKDPDKPTSYDLSAKIIGELFLSGRGKVTPIIAKTLESVKSFKEFFPSGDGTRIATLSDFEQANQLVKQIILNPETYTHYELSAILKHLLDENYGAAALAVYSQPALIRLTFGHLVDDPVYKQLFAQADAMIKHYESNKNKFSKRDKPSGKKEEPSEAEINALVRAWHDIGEILDESPDPYKTNLHILYDRIKSSKSASPMLILGVHHFLRENYGYTN